MKTEIKNRDWVNFLINKYPSVETGQYSYKKEYIVQISNKLNLVAIYNEDNTLSVEVIEVDDALYGKLNNWYSIEELENNYGFNFDILILPEEKIFKKIFQ